jgi:hypothetical protein
MHGTTPLGSSAGCVTYLVLNTTADLTYTSPIALAGGVKTRAAAIAVLQDHDFYLHTDPHLTGYEAEDEAGRGWADYKVPEAVAARALQQHVHTYKVTDYIPNPFWDSNVVSHEEIVNTDDGLWVRLRSPLSVVMETRWTVRDAADGQLELVEQVHISCSRVLMGMTKGSGEFFCPRLGCPLRCGGVSQVLTERYHDGS